MQLCLSCMLFSYACNFDDLAPCSWVASRAKVHSRETAPLYNFDYREPQRPAALALHLFPRPYGQHAQQPLHKCLNA